MIKKKLLGLSIALVASASTLSAQTTLGAFTFNNGLFGNSVTASDGGAFYANNWLNTANTAPGQTAALTGVNFNTGIANIGITGALSYTIGYTSGIVNNAGADLGIVVARFSTDNFFLSVSTDGSSFSAEQAISGASAVNTGDSRSYFYAGGGPFSAGLFVHSIDLSDFGIANSGSVVAVRVRATTELDLIRAAGFGNTTVTPEPSTYALMSAGLLALGLAARRKQRGA